MNKKIIRSGFVLSLLSASILFAPACGNNPNPYAPTATPYPTATNNSYIPNNINLPSGGVTGKVIDFITKSPIIGVKVSVVGVRPEISAMTNGAGTFTLPRVPEGRQVLTVSKKDYTKATSSNIIADIKVGSTVSIADINILGNESASSNAFVKIFEGFKHPLGLGINKNTGELYVVDVIGIGNILSYERAEIKKINSDGGLLLSFGSRLLSSDLSSIDLFRLLKNASGIGVDGGGNIYVADTGHSVVKKYGPEGKYVSEIKKDFSNVYDVAVTTQGNVLVSDPSNSRVILLDSSNNVILDNLLKDRPSDGVRGITTDGADNIYVVDASGAQGQVIKIYDKYGVRLPLQFGRLGGLEPGSFNNPTDIAVDAASGDIYVVDSGNNRIQRFNAQGNYLSEFGQFGTANGSFNKPWGIAIDSAGYIYVSDTQNARIQKFMPGRITQNNL